MECPLLQNRHQLGGIAHLLLDEADDVDGALVFDDVWSGSSFCFEFGRKKIVNLLVVDLEKTGSDCELGLGLALLDLQEE